MSLIIFIIILLVLVLVHESGHFFSAKAFGIKVEEFGFGFPPKIFGKKFGETEYTLNWLPLGGFVKIFGENPEENEDLGADSDRSFVSKPRWQQALVLFAGVFANFLLAWLLLSIGFFSGLPVSTGSAIEGSHLSNINLVVVSTLPNSPAEKAGLRSGDKILSIQSGGKSAALTPDALKNLVVGSGGKEVDITYTHGSSSEQKTAVIVPNWVKSDKSYEIGISMDEVGTAKLPFFKAIGEGLRLDWYLTQNTAMGLFTLIKEGLHGSAQLSTVTGPVGMVAIVGDAYQFGLIYLLSFAALISINLAIINSIPFPALDGGRLLFLLIEKIKGSRINPRVANLVNSIGFYALIFLMLIVTYHDLVKLL